MPWTMNDYPSSMKNLDDATKKKAIDIANSMIDDDYDEGRAIPIAIEQAKEWRRNHDKQDVKDYKKKGKPTQRSEEGKEYDNNPERLEEGEQVISHEDGWAVQSTNAKKPSKVYKNKDEAIERAKEIAENKGTSITIFNKEGSIQKQQSYKS
ncbi:DUF2188 domain-containing protein [Virgibacillus halodenitrificans]|jgi:uncharacterized protein YdaT|uniref:DUF2188 domain-containing protein n=1 Tax=Virgibacillus halodenitrificans TaxID=1482 RepID=A0AAC9NJV1_VIRHA|nr:DUF2188 domain-containing protein [Virgibacillus halodenitrificans]APC47019.1 hypothetical protein BME96_01895 [Virgibacillus halodenitrificans]MBD1223065.1 DUF2188 domain-containing protein [Virgibacillus halodenitrificans]MCJ0930323.1 DUF2188 domain-containing protein [Virgibacillus halodenitrificans]MEC2159117.1 DUF2188 domain-containing protein [Virgibacillus halodenitrificans]WHX25252.1 DUF2188 domain-containing protein [Virgibacillus halodenitrificans]